jgi:choline dehydrogenase-like flavoprotein
MADADVIIIGSGFGGSVTACRLAQAGAKVLVLERGREWSPANFPRAPTDPWIFDANNPLARHGWFDLRIWPNMTVAAGAGVGGGSLVYANISVEAKKDSFDAGWPAGITYDVLAPYYAEVGRMMEVQRVPRRSGRRARSCSTRPRRRPAGRTGSARWSSPCAFDLRTRTTSRIRTTTRSRKPKPTFTVSNRARACISASATSAAP